MDSSFEIKLNQLKKDLKGKFQQQQNQFNDNLLSSLKVHRDQIIVEIKKSFPKENIPYIQKLNIHENVSLLIKNLNLIQKVYWDHIIDKNEEINIGTNIELMTNIAEVYFEILDALIEFLPEKIFEKPEEFPNTKSNLIIQEINEEFDNLMQELILLSLSYIKTDFMMQSGSQKKNKDIELKCGKYLLLCKLHLTFDATVISI